MIRRPVPEHPPTEPAAPPSKSQRKRDMTELQALGESLLRLSTTELARIDLPEPLREALAGMARIGSHEAGIGYADIWRSEPPPRRFGSSSSPGCWVSRTTSTLERSWINPEYRASVGLDGREKPTGPVPRSCLIDPCKSRSMAIWSFPRGSTTRHATSTVEPISSTAATVDSNSSNGCSTCYRWSLSSL